MRKQFKQLLWAGMLLPFVLSACTSVIQTNELSGTWRSQGYGLFFTVEPDAVEIYQVTDVSCVRMVEVGTVDYQGQLVTINDVTLPGVGQFMGTFEYQLTLDQNDRLNFEIGKTNPIQAERVDSLPVVCNEVTNATPEETFDTFWYMYDEHYAFFDVRGVDWQEMYDIYRPQVSPTTTEEELFEIFQQMVEPLGDGHVSINSMVGSYTAIDLPEWLPPIDPDGMEEFISQHALDIANHYLIEPPRFAANDGLLYGKLSETVGYVSILTFDGSLTEAGDMQPLTDAMAMILDEFKMMDAMVIDIRINFGGEDTNGFFIAGHFTDAPVLISQKSVWFDDSFHPIKDLSINPTTSTPFTGDIYVLTSKLSISAAETFALAMRELPNVTLVGEATNGMLSDAWFAVLPNGWISTLSNEEYLAADGSLYEGIGVPVDVPVEITFESFNADTDQILESALELAHRQRN